MDQKFGILYLMTLGSFEFRKKHSLQHNFFGLIFFLIPCYETMRLPSRLVVDSVIRFLDTDLSLLERFSLIVVKRKEVVTVTSVLYSCKTLKTHSSLWGGKLTHYG